MKIINTALLDEQPVINSDEASWVYNGLDCAVTYEIRDELKRQLALEPECVQLTYANALAKQAPVMEMSMRGFRIDEAARQTALRALTVDLLHLQKNFDRLLAGAFNTTLNWRSPLQLKNFFYGTLGLKPVRGRNSKGEYSATTGRAALEKLSEHFFAKVFCNYILAMRDLGKQIGFLKTEIDPDGRMRSSFNIAGTNSGRLASRMNEFGTGTNVQNVSRQLRYPFIADPKMIIVNVDLKQADTRNVGAIIWETFSDDPRAGDYLDACESGDLHTTVCRMAWPDLAWPDDRAGWRAIADQNAYREMSYRDLAKRLGHGTNYLGTPRTMAHHTKTEQKLIEEFQERYFAAFPLIKKWHEDVAEQLQFSGSLTTLFGRRRFFFGRPSEDTTIREAVAYAPQSMTAEEIDRGYTQLWRACPDTQLLVQVHDSITFQAPYATIKDRLPVYLETLKVPLQLSRGRTFLVPLDAKVGWNWGDIEYKNNMPSGNLNGLDKWKTFNNRLPPNPKRRLSDFL
jgi:DNA polymerase-1